MKFDVYGVTDTGCVRQLNEDNFCICGFENNNEPGYCVVADGMGGHNAGEVASQLAIDFITESSMIYFKTVKILMCQEELMMP